MLIRKTQIADMERSRQGSFEERVIDYIIKRSTENVYDEPAKLRSAIHAQTEEALQLGIVNEDDILSFIEIRIYLGDKWTAPEFAWVYEYLGELSSPKVRISNVIERLRFHGEQKP